MADESLSTPPKRKTPADIMRIRTNPHFQLDEDPNEQEWAYVNPVQLSNDLIVIANEMLVLAEESSKAIKDNQKARLEKKKLERLLEDLETDYLAKDPLTPSEAKSLKTIAAAIERRIVQGAAHLTQYRVWKSSARDLEDRMDRNEAIIRAAKLYWETAEKVSSNITVKLSWEKDERRRA